jgi:hypothetical protein
MKKEKAGIQVPPPGVTRPHLKKNWEGEGDPSPYPGETPWRKNEND